jgi:ubiquitin-activating enzyme E1
LTDASLELQLQVNDYCRQHKIGYISADTYGAFAVAFADFGDVFEVFDKNGESPKEVMLQRIDKGTETHLFSLENNMHGLEEGDWVKFSEIQGMTELNYADQAEYIHRVKKVVTPYEFVIETDSTGFSDYTTGGIAIEVKKPFSMNFLSLRDALQKPDFVVSDLAKFEQPGQLHIAVQALHQFVSLKGHFPRPWNSEDSDALVAIARDINEKSSAKVDPLNETLVKQLSWTARGNIIGLTAFLGGIMAQEVIKCLSGKFTPLHQWLYFDAVELLPDHTDASFNVQDYTPSGNRYDGQVVLIGKKNNDILLNGKTFMVCDILV